MKTERTPWDKLEIIAKRLSIFLILVFIVTMGFLGYRLTELTAASHDVDIVNRFKDLYYYKGTQNTRRLSIYYIRLIDDFQTRYALRQFVIWDALERNMSIDFRFDQELSDWHMVGDTIYDMAEDDPDQAKLFWCNLEKITLKRWPQQEAELIKLYKWIGGTYQKDDLTWANCQ